MNVRTQRTIINAEQSEYLTGYYIVMAVLKGTNADQQSTLAFLNPGNHQIHLQ